MKLIVDAETDKVLGVHMAGPDAPEIVQVRVESSNSNFLRCRTWHVDNTVSFAY